MAQKIKTEEQRARIEALEAEGKRTYAESVQGKGVVAAFERYLTTGDSEKITNGLYHLATMRGGYIAHFNIHGFRQVYSDPADFLRGEMYGLRTWGIGGNGNQWHPNFDASPYVYTDGMTDGEVYKQCCEIADRLADEVLRRSVRQQSEREIETAKALAERNGLKVVEA